MSKVIAPLCFAFLGALVARHVRPDALIVSVGGALGLAYGRLAFWLIGRLLAAANASLHTEPGGVARAIADGGMVLLPFTALAALAELYLGWNAVQPFASAGIMAAAAGSGAAAAKAGGDGGWRNMVQPTACAMLLSAVWMCASTYGAVALGAARAP
jgi:hypothetical protein